MEYSNKDNNKNILSEIKHQKQQIKQLQRLSSSNHSWFLKSPKLIKLNRRRLSLAKIKLRELMQEKDKLSQDRIVISDKLETLFMIAKGLKPELTDKINNLLIK